MSNSKLNLLILNWLLIGHVVYSTSSKIPENKIGQPIFYNSQSIFPESLLKLHLKPPKNAHGHIFQYYISLKYGNIPDDCVYWIYKCTSCKENLLSVKNGKEEELCRRNDGRQISYTDQNNMNDIQVNVTDKSIIQPFKNYTLNAQGRNIWGWGDLLTTTLNTSEYKSSAPENITAFNYSFVKKWFQISFTTPSDPNGQILEYVILINTTGNSVCFEWNVKCSDCGIKDGKPNGSKIALSDCSKPDNELASFSKMSKNITIKTKSKLNIQYNTVYYIAVQARNGWGWGNVSKAQFETENINPSKKYNALDNLNLITYIVCFASFVIIFCIFTSFIIKKYAPCETAPITKVVVPTQSSSSITRPTKSVISDDSANHSISINSSSLMRPARPKTGVHLIANNLTRDNSINRSTSNNNSSLARPTSHTSTTTRPTTHHTRNNTGNRSNNISSMARPTKTITRESSRNQAISNKLDYERRPLKPNNRDISAIHHIKNHEPNCKIYDNMYDLEDEENFYANSAPAIPPRLNASGFDATNEISYESLME